MDWVAFGTIKYIIYGYGTIKLVLAVAENVHVRLLDDLRSSDNIIELRVLPEYRPEYRRGGRRGPAGDGGTGSRGGFTASYPTQKITFQVLVWILGWSYFSTCRYSIYSIGLSKYTVPGYILEYGESYFSWQIGTFRMQRSNDRPITIIKIITFRE